MARLIDTLPLALLAVLAACSADVPDPSRDPKHESASSSANDAVQPSLEQKEGIDLPSAVDPIEPSLEEKESIVLSGLDPIEPSLEEGEGVDLPLPAGDCFDGITNGAEGDIDCGGVCAAKCNNNQWCSIGSDCASGVCTDFVCAPPRCDDGIKNFKETGLDCGGTCATKCGAGEGCFNKADCAGALACVNGTCQ